MRRRDFLQASAAVMTRGLWTARGQTSASTAVKDVSWLARVQTPPVSLPADTPKLSPLLSFGGQPIRTLTEWQFRRRILRQWWLDFLGPTLPRATVPIWKIVEQDTTDGVVRSRIAYEVEPGVLTEAYLLRPEAASNGPRPAVVVLHSTVAHSIRQPAGLGPDPEKAFGLSLARRGFITLSPRNFLWPVNERIDAQAETTRFQEQHPHVKGMARMLRDAQIAIDLLSVLPGVNAQRIGCVGHSLGAKEVLYLAAFDERIRATVSSEGGIGLRFSNWDAEWYLGSAINAPEFTREQHEILALVAPRPFLLIGGDSADGDRSWPFIDAVLPVYRLYGNPARVGLLNHKGGHAVPFEAERAIVEWMEAYV